MTRKLGNRITSMDVARLAGVSQSTVSRAFVEGAYISESVGKKVIDAANTLGYRTNYINSGFFSKHSNLIGIVASTNPNYNENNTDMFATNLAPLASSRLYSVIQETILQNMHPLIMPVQQQQGIDMLIRQFIAYRVKGIICTAEDPSLEMVKECKDHNIPMVLMQRNPSIQDAYHVCDSPMAVARLALKMLSPRKHKKIGVLSCAEDMSLTIRSRMEIFQSYVVSQGYELVIYEAKKDYYQDFYNLAYKIKQDLNELDSIFGVIDRWSIAVLESLKDIHIKVPKDVQILGFDNKNESNLTSVQLSTIEENLSEQARSALHFIEGHCETKHITYRTRFQQIQPVYRKTTRKRKP